VQCRYAGNFRGGLSISWGLRKVEYRLIIARNTYGALGGVLGKRLCCGLDLSVVEAHTRFGLDKIVTAHTGMEVNRANGKPVVLP